VIHPFSAAIGEPHDIRMNMSGFVAAAGIKLFL
jgi:hypothetical protein